MNTPNTPYVKKFDSNGKLTNPIKRLYPSTGLNRKQRRSKDSRSISNRSGNSLVLTKHRDTVIAYHRVKQYIKDSLGRVRMIVHYVPKKP